MRKLARHLGARLKDNGAIAAKLAVVLTSFALLSEQARAQSEVVNWTGVFAGGFIGGMAGPIDVEGTRFTYDTNRALNTVDHDLDGIILGVHGGANFQLGMFVAGVEAEYAKANLRDDKVFNSDNDIDQASVTRYAVVAGRLGLAFDRFLAYGKGGVAFARINTLGGDVDAGGFDLADAYIRHKTYTGYAVGGGLEYALTDVVSFKAEYLYMDFKGFSTRNQQSANQIYSVDIGGFHTGKFGISFRF